MSGGSWAITAMVLLAVDHHPGKWVSLDLIVQHVLAPVARVQEHCDELVVHGQIESCVIDGRQYYGTRVAAGAAAELVE